MLIIVIYNENKSLRNVSLLQHIVDENDKEKDNDERKILKIATITLTIANINTKKKTMNGERWNLLLLFFVFVFLMRRCNINGFRTVNQMPEVFDNDN